MILLLLATADRTLRKGVRAFKKESNLKVPASLRQQGNRSARLLATCCFFSPRGTLDQAAPVRRDYSRTPIHVATDDCLLNNNCGGC